MSICVCWGGSTFEQVTPPVCRLLALFERGHIEIIRSSGQIDDVSSAPSPDELAEWMVADTTDAVSLSSGASSLNIYSPHFQGHLREGYLCVLEVSDDQLDEARACYTACKSSGATFVTLSEHDFPNFEPAVREENFPWGWLGLLVGAVRRADGTWLEREGTEHFPRAPLPTARLRRE